MNMREFINVVEQDTELVSDLPDDNNDTVNSEKIAVESSLLNDDARSPTTAFDKFIKASNTWADSYLNKPSVLDNNKTSSENRDNHLFKPIKGSVRGIVKSYDYRIDPDHVWSKLSQDQKIRIFNSIMKKE